MRLRLSSSRSTAIGISLPMKSPHACGCNKTRQVAASGSGCCDTQQIVLADRVINSGSATFSRVIRVPEGQSALAQVTLLAVSEDMTLDIVWQGACSEHGAFLEIGSPETIDAVGAISLECASFAYPFLRMKFSSVKTGVIVFSAVGSLRTA